MPRCYNHDYKSRCIYHITLKKAPGVESFGYLCGGVRNAEIVRSELGVIIERNLRQISRLSPALKLLQYCVMPDHVHLLLFVMAPIDLHLGQYISKLKILIYQEYRMLKGIGIAVFERDFYDCILHRGRSLDTLFRYLRENPRRLAVRKACPEFFRRVSSMRIGGADCQAYGNLQLLENPFREQVVVHRADTPATRRSNRDLWLHTASNGGVLVSPFISPAEKAIRAEAEEAGGRIILIIHEPMGERYKPAGRDFELCERGSLLIVSARRSGALTRETCLAMNSLAAAAAS